MDNQVVLFAGVLAGHLKDIALAGLDNADLDARVFGRIVDHAGK